VRVRAAALIVAAGRGERLGGGAPKQYLPLAGRPLLRHALERFARHPRVAAVRVVIGAGQAEAYGRAAAGLDVLPPVEGGPSRQASGLLGLESLGALAPTHVLIHDAARPLLSDALVGRVLDALVEGAEGALPVLPVADTLKRLEGDAAVGGPDRHGLARAQTPQGFRFDRILAAHRLAAGRELTDDAAVAEAAGLTVRHVRGEERNIKVTVPDDLALARLLLEGGPRAYRTGLGYDVHAFAEGRPLVLCGVRVPHSHGLAGHSDADAPLHAVTDALLGTVGAGDIGQHFPPSDERWRDADSAAFVRHARGLVEARGGRVESVDLVIVCERPRIGPHREAMAARLATLLGLAPDRVGVKATTSEGLGFTGRGEGLTAQAVATVSFPAGGEDG
jgi:2-C-methyl-D-erythritol 4-phosphate cytidylyltransferase / 2-C-methyl-D-erythritol 2,4-cyclodiphosphate synthase